MSAQKPAHNLDVGSIAALSVALSPLSEGDNLPPPVYIYCLLAALRRQMAGPAFWATAPIGF